MNDVISEKPLKLRGEGGGAVSLVVPFILAGGELFEPAPIETRSFAMEPESTPVGTTLNNGSRRGLSGGRGDYMVGRFCVIAPSQRGPCLARSTYSCDRSNYLRDSLRHGSHPQIISRIF